VNNSSLLASEKFHCRDLNLRPTDPEGGTLSTQPPRLDSAINFMSLISYERVLNRYDCLVNCLVMASRRPIFTFQLTRLCYRIK